MWGLGVGGRRGREGGGGGREREGGREGEGEGDGCVYIIDTRLPRRECECGDWGGGTEEGKGEAELWSY